MVLSQIENSQCGYYLLVAQLDSEIYNCAHWLKYCRCLSTDSEYRGTSKLKKQMEEMVGKMIGTRGIGTEKIGEKFMIARTPKGDDTSTRVWGYVCEDVSIVGEDMFPQEKVELRVLRRYRTEANSETPQPEE